MTFKEEIRLEEAKLKRFRARIKILDLQKWACDQSKLKLAYEDQCHILNIEQPLARQKTAAQFLLETKIKNNTKIKFYDSVWIANRNIDIFLPGLAGQYVNKIKVACFNNRFRGLAIEVDGKIHDQSLKLKKDISKQELLHSLGIGLLTIENCDTRSMIVHSILSQFKSLPCLDTRAKRRVWRNIYVYTLCFHSPDDVMSEVFNLDFKGVNQ